MNYSIVPELTEELFYQICKEHNLTPTIISSPLKLHTWVKLKISAFGIDKDDAIKRALIGVLPSEIDELRNKLKTTKCKIKSSNLRK